MDYAHPESRPVMIDGFAGSGAAAMGYHRAGFRVIGVDNDPARLALYPFESVLGDVFVELPALVSRHDAKAVHLSPTCTGYSRGTAAIPDRIGRYDRLIGASRELARMLGLPYVIENVADARPELIDPIELCWSMFRDPGSVIDTDGTPLTMRRHRLFEWDGFYLPAPPPHRHPRGVQVAGAYGGARRDKWEARHVRHGGYVPRSLAVLRDLIGADWLDERGCFLAIPPDYTEWVGRYLMAAVR